MVSRPGFRLANDSDEIKATTPSTVLADYSRKIEPTDQLPADLTLVLMGLFGEVGGILAAFKKRVRDKASYSEYNEAVEEEFGDVIWYFTTLCRRLGVCIDSVVEHKPIQTISAIRRTSDQGCFLAPEISDSHLACALLDLGAAAAALLRIDARDPHGGGLLRGFWIRYMAALRAADIDLRAVAARNLHKVFGRFLEPDPLGLPTFDERFPADERFPDRFEIKVAERPSGQTYLQWNGVFIGDPLTDNIAVSDGYRFHDVFHLAHAAILHWSPAFRSLIKRKRKTDPKVDEDQDGGRAIVVEEGLTAWIFSCAKRLDYFESRAALSFDLLKTVQQFVRGYEVEACPLFLWEKAILQGYEVLRKVRVNNGGVIVGDRSRRTICFRPLTEACV